MSYTKEDLGKNMVKLTIEVEAAEVDKALKGAYNKIKGQVSLPGFRKGKVPYNMLVKMYGESVLYDDAADILISPAYREAVTESGIQVVAQPEIEVLEIEGGKPCKFTATVAVKPEVKLGQYKGVEVEKVAVEVTDDEITAAIDKEREANARLITVEDRPSQMGDTVIIDFEGFVDGVAFDGGKGEDHALVLGSHTFIDNFEDQLVGKNAGEDVDVNVTFPEDYNASNLKGKAAVFKCKVKEIKFKELPELDDEFASEVSEFETVAEYKDDVKKKLTEQKEQDAKNKKADAAMDKVVENAEMDIPDPMVDEQARQMLNDMAYRMQAQGLAMEQYMQLTGMTVDKLLEQQKPVALKRIQQSLVLEAIADAENILPTDEDVDAELQKMADMYKMDLDKLKDSVSEDEKEQIKGDLRLQKAAELVSDSAVEK